MACSPLQDRARRLGVATSYIDVDQRPRPSSDRAIEAVCDVLATGAAADPGPTSPVDQVVLLRGDTLVSGVQSRFDGPASIEVVLDDGSVAAAVRAESSAELSRALGPVELPIGIHWLEWTTATGESGRATLLVAPERFPGASRSRPGLALFTPVYSLWSDDHPLPSYRGLSELGQAVSGLAVDTIATLPMHAPGLGDRFDPSPYAPVSRFHWNELLVPGPLLGAPATPVQDRSASSIDWAAVVQARTRQLGERCSRLTEVERGDLARFLGRRPDVVSYARFCAAGDDGVRRLHEVGQWLAEAALGEVVRHLETAGIRLALDLPVGARRDSWEVSEWPELFVTGASIGAPPDTFFAHGQDWGLPPLSPVASRGGGHRVWHDLLDTACRYAQVVRIDHVMQFHRLWWVPEGHDADDGVYVHYPADELLGVAAIVAHRTGTAMVGENLGTVSPAMTKRLNDWGLAGMYEEAFAAHALSAEGPSGTATLPPIPAGSWAGVRTHDMDPLASIDHELDLSRYREALGAELGHPVGPTSQDLLVAMIDRLRASTAMEVVIDVDDILGVEAPHNVPGTVAASNWSRRLDRPVGSLVRDQWLRRVLDDRSHPRTTTTP